MTDAELIGRFQKGQVGAFNTLVWRWQHRLYGFVLRYTGNHEDARDVCQQVLLHAYRQLGRLREPERFSSWLYQSALNACCDRQRQRRRHPEISLSADEDGAGGVSELADLPERSADAPAERRDLRDLLARALQALPDEQRTVVVMKTYQDLRFAEIADVLGIPVNTAKSRLYHGLRALRRQLDSWGLGEGSVSDDL